MIGGIGGGGGVLENDLESLKCANFDRTDEFEGEDMIDGRDGVSKSGAVSGVSVVVSEVIPSLRHEPSPWECELPSYDTAILIVLAVSDSYDAQSRSIAAW